MTTLLYITHQEALDAARRLEEKREARREARREEQARRYLELHESAGKLAAQESEE